MSFKRTGNKMMQIVEISSKDMEVRPNTISELKVDATFRKISKTSICFNVWRIDEDRLEAVPKAQYGVFSDDCAYIIYAAAPIGTYINQDTINRETKQGVRLERFIHFWLGEKVSEQKRSNVAHKIQELDSYFGNVATEYRETQENESARFLSYFKKGITIRSGLLASSTTTTRLYKLHGRQWLYSIEMETVSWKHFKCDDIMLLKTNSYIFVWLGRSSSNIERHDAIDFGKKLQPNVDQIVIIDDGYEQSIPDAPKIVWNDNLPLAKREVQQFSMGVDNIQSNKLKIYKCSYKGSRLHLEQLDVVIPTKEDLNDSMTAYVIDGYMQGVWLWVGSRAPHQDSVSAMGNGRAFVKKKKYPYVTPVMRVVEGHEPIEFVRLFPNWHSEWYETAIVYKPVSSRLGKFDSFTLCERPKMAADTQLVDNGTGERIIYRITKDQVVEVPLSKVIMFSTHCCYVVQYSIAFISSNPADIENIGIKTIIYQWNGSEAATETLSKAEAFAKNCFHQFPEKSMFIQMSEFDETPHFLQIFDGKLIILLNKSKLHTANLKLNNFDSTSSMYSNDHFVLKIYGDASYNSKAIEIYPLSSLNSKDCYVIKSNHIWVWCGQCSTGDTREVAKSIGDTLGESALAMEGKEPKEFWDSISSQMNQPCPENAGINGNCCGKISPQLSGYLSNYTTETRPLVQLFLVWIKHGKFHKHEIIGFEQSDLSPECTYILDAGIVSYIWLGQYISKHDKENYMSVAHLYLQTIPIARRPNTAVAAIRQHNEPNVFKGFFDNWSTSYWKTYVSYEQQRHLLSMGSDEVSVNSKMSNGNGNSSNASLPPALLNNKNDFDTYSKYPLSVLQQEIDSLPSEINPLKREVHLTHDDFVSIFNMSFWEYDILPAWKKQELKKKHKLF